MIGDKMEKAFNDQIREEYFSSYLYLSMSAWFEAMNLRGFANWMKVQFHEELMHALGFYTHLIGRGGSVKLQAIEEPQSKWDSPLAAFEATLKHEQHITGCIHKLVELAQDKKDYAAAAFLQWYVTEQVEEEANAEEILHKLKLIGDNMGGLYMLDRELAARAFAPPTGLAV
jgi:ferritin